MTTRPPSQPVLLGFPKPKKPAPAQPWLKEAANDWVDRFHGPCPGVRVARALRVLVDSYGWPDVRHAWRNYLSETDPRFVSPERFAMTFGFWAGIPSDITREPAG